MSALRPPDSPYSDLHLTRVEGKVYCSAAAAKSCELTYTSAYQPVLLKRVYFESLGILVNAVLLRVLVEIENQEDISEEASHRLNDLCKMLHELEGLFMDGEEVCSLFWCSDKAFAEPTFIVRSLPLRCTCQSGLNSSSCLSCLKPPW